MVRLHLGYSKLVQPITEPLPTIHCFEWEGRVDIGGPAQTGPTAVKRLFSGAGQLTFGEVEGDRKQTDH